MDELFTCLAKVNVSTYSLNPILSHLFMDIDLAILSLSFSLFLFLSLSLSFLCHWFLTLPDPFHQHLNVIFSILKTKIKNK